MFNWRKGESSAETWHPLSGPFMKEMVEVKGERSERPAGTVHLLGSWKRSRERPPSALTELGPARISLDQLVSLEAGPLSVHPGYPHHLGAC